MTQKLSVYQCRQCGNLTVQIPGYCSGCSSKAGYDLVEAGRTGTVFSHTTVHICEEKFQHEAPYQLAVIECEGNLRLLGRIENHAANPVTIGSSVELSCIRDGAAIFKRTS